MTSRPTLSWLALLFIAYASAAASQSAGLAAAPTEADQIALVRTHFPTRFQQTQPADEAFAFVIDESRQVIRSGVVAKRVGEDVVSGIEQGLHVSLKPRVRVSGGGCFARMHEHGQFCVVWAVVKSQ